MSGPRFQVEQVWAQRSGKQIQITSVSPVQGDGSCVLTYEYVDSAFRGQGRTRSDNARRNWTFVGTFVGCK